MEVDKMIVGEVMGLLEGLRKDEDISGVKYLELMLKLKVELKREFVDYLGCGGIEGDELKMYLEKWEGE